ncbi:energy-coupling factor ABC transporter ATP-binding protein [Gynuella sunshinyii]|uniref:ABC-type cobalt transport system, ATPase component n=1 Tax=Gynuella sunshinyii YC6258 TaxID=1445510 RepID=A0A0C5VCW9_9GAMM|nr:ABC transporter ATP-binding protein [Gynuella sunshinyii]AJQ92342.1 ABC-type cobalt transport system, ATPase component [Gynuella sunshinyii YC6258]
MQDHISLTDVCLERDGITVLNNINLHLTEARIALIGSNGSGKSSLARLLNGLLQATAGTISVCGEDPKKGIEAMHRRVGFIFQNPDHQLIFPTVLEELSFGLMNIGKTRRQAHDQAMSLLRQHDHEEWANMSVHALSEGQKQLVCIFAVLLMEPKLLILDEPFSALDLLIKKQLLRILDQQAPQMLMISHDLDAIYHFDRVIWLEHGRVREDGPAPAVIDHYRQWVASQLENHP